MDKAVFYFIIFLIVCFVVFIASSTEYVVSVQGACEAGPYEQLADCLRISDNFRPAFFDVIFTLTYVFRVIVGFLAVVAVGHLMHRVIKGPRADKQPRSKKKKQR